MAVGKTPLDVETKLMEAVPKRYVLHAHHWLICTAAHPHRPPNICRCMLLSSSSVTTAT